MIRLPAGEILLRDERKKTNWAVSVEAFWLDPFPVTRELFQAVQAELPSLPGPARAPVVDVSWNEAIRFCNRLSQQRGLRPCYRHGDDPHAHDVVWDRDADGYRLPTEAEWEHACRAGTSEPRYGPLDDIAWHEGNAGGHAHEVGSRLPNAWGLHDMIGNVWEWCWDVYDPEVYGPYRVFRGGGWADRERACRASCRRRSHPTFHIDDLGFRLARTADALACP
jgi:formylglycine-generating enzyme required for sulfatase activity